MMRLVQAVMFSGRRLLESSCGRIRLFGDGVSSTKGGEKSGSDGIISVFRLGGMIFVWTCGVIWLAAHLWIMLIRWLLECKLSNFFPIDRSTVKRTSGKLGEELKQHPERVTVNDKSCALCCATFNLLFNKRLQCAECEACVCRDCSSYDARNKVWYCRLCDQKRSLRAQSCEWFYDKVKMRFNQFGSTKVLLSMYGPKKDLEGPEPEQEMTDIQQHMESVLEGFLGEALDSACVSRMFNHLSYDQVVLDHRMPLHEAVLRFSGSLLVAMRDKPKESDLTPTNTHADLKECVQRLCRDAIDLPCLRDVCQTNRRNSSSAFSDMSDECDDISFDAYEDLLVMAVINKAVEIGQRKYGSSGDGKAGDKSCQPDIIQTSKKEQIDVGCQSDIPFSDSGQDEEGFTETTESDEFFWTRSPKEEAFPYIMEEKIEEEITEAYTESEDDPSRPDSDEPNGNVLLALDLSQQNRVPFPEMGVDLVDPGMFLRGEEEEDPGVLVASIMDWEENWLFRKKQRSAALAAFRGGRYMRYFDPINMLIPNPIKQECVLLGSREVDEFSEMSEKLSVGSLELSSLSESEEETLSDVQFSRHDTSGSEEPKKPVASQQPASHCSPPLLRPDSVESPQWMSSSKTPGLTTHQPTPAPRSTTQKGSPQKRMVKRDIPKFQPMEERKSPVSLHFLSQPDATTVVHAGKAAKFLCEISSPKVLGVAWFRGTEPLTSTENCRFYRIRGMEFLLELYNVSKADEGTYSAVAYTEKEQLWCDFSLAVRATARAYNRPDFTVAPHVAEWTGEDHVRISCTVSGYPDPRVFFLHDGLPVPEDSQKFAIENEGYGEWSLQVKNPTVQDKVEYSAVAKNCLGETVKTVIFRLGHLKPRSKEPPNGVIPTNIGTKSRPLVIQRTWADREAELHSTATAHKKENGLRQDEELSSFKNVDEEMTFVPSLELFNSPPKPGTIAEREHAKWLNAVPLENNPYSAENLTKRAFLGRKDSILSNTAHEDVENPFSPPVLPAACVRDYYINNPKLLARVVPQRFTNETSSEMEGCEERLHSFEEQMYSTPRKAFSPTFQRQQVRSPPPLPETPPPGITCEHGSHWSLKPLKTLEFENAVFKTTGSESSDRKIEEDLSLPSVRELVLKFASPSTQSSVPSEAPLLEFRSPEKGKEGGSCDQLKAWNMNKIHSLTARSLSREFREHAQKNLVPRQMNRTHLTHSATSSLDTASSTELQKRAMGGDTTPGYASDESSNSSASAPTARVIGAKRRQKTSRNLLQRTSYWERRAEQGLLSDSSVTEEFPQGSTQEAGSRVEV